MWGRLGTLGLAMTKNVKKAGGDGFVILFLIPCFIHLKMGDEWEMGCRIKKIRYVGRASLKTGGYNLYNEQELVGELLIAHKDVGYDGVLIRSNQTT